ncbi:S8 family peptidase [Anaerocolumna sp. AGMB13020]|uniref:S8 family peptidase n=1 Tax=Anaerocolumna sp. AGMB13020 TaxID=3081750 RepID=UPI0029533CE2|nr:S8 family peptidase [Anaerocolumna sp. AGMB13020]WOO37380.1 S8 family peptidase [Anaerocolumna sp. AGMB13020]
MTQEEQNKIISNDYIDVLIEYDADLTRMKDVYGETMQILDDTYAVAYIPVSKTQERLVGDIGYTAIPKLFGLLESPTIEAVGLNRLARLPGLNLKGEGVILGFVDTGIDYSLSVFRKSDNTTRIISIWDQTIVNPEATPETYNYGKVYTEDNINEALRSEAPLSVVPSVDELGHGTALAGLAGGGEVQAENFTGIATLAELAMVKLKLAKENLKEYLFVPAETIAYQENDIMAGVLYLVNLAKQRNKPIVICIGLGSNMGGHDGREPISLMLSRLGERNGVVVVLPAGNEGAAGHHYFGTVEDTTNSNLVEVNVAEDENGFTMELWGQAPGVYSIDITSPSGEYIPRIPARLGESRTIRFLFESTILYISYLIAEAQTGDQLIFLRFVRPAPGIWRFRVYGIKDITTGFHIWLPMTGFVREATRFVKPNPETTITTPGNAGIPITVTAYDYRNQSIYLNAGRGFTRLNNIKPELAAPGVELLCPSSEGFVAKTGTSMAAAVTAGIGALLLEWGLVRGKLIYMDSTAVKQFLIRGVKRSTNEAYPNKVWGFGMIDIYRTFDSLRGESTL